MLKNSIVKTASLFTLILAFMVATVVAIAGVMKTENTTEAEKKVSVKKEIALETWYFNPDPLDPNPDPNLSSNYSRTAPPGVQCGAPSGDICSIQDEASSENEDQPQMSHGNVTDDTADLYSKSFRQ